MEKANLGRLFGKAKSSVEALAVPHIGDIPTVECLCSFVFANLGVAVQNLQKIKASVLCESVIFHGFISTAREQTPDITFCLDVRSTLCKVQEKLICGIKFVCVQRDVCLSRAICI